MNKAHKEEKNSLLRDLDKIMINYKIYSESHRQNLQVKEDYNQIKSESESNYQIHKQDQELIR